MPPRPGYGTSTHTPHSHTLSILIYTPCQYHTHTVNIHSHTVNIHSLIERAAECPPDLDMVRHTPRTHPVNITHLLSISHTDTLTVNIHSLTHTPCQYSHTQSSSQHTLSSPSRILYQHSLIPYPHTNTFPGPASNSYVSTLQYSATPYQHPLIHPINALSYPILTLTPFQALPLTPM